ncbi:MAG: nitroreductase family protein [Clostridia bacterium]|jgi:nitroreductase|nr:nitroreductase family protein [Clostridia bacterium]
MLSLIKKNRSYRRFYEDVLLDKETLEGLVNLARLSPSGGNLQPLKYIISWEEEINSKIFSCLLWAAYLKDWLGPEKGERPTGYIIVLGDTEISKSFGVDPGIACQSILLGAVEKGLGGCILGNIKRDALRKELGIPKKYEILYVLALGKPKEEVVLEHLEPGGDVKYWRDENKVHHVPKRALQDIIIKL